MSIAVIGGAGYIGSHVVRALEARDDDVVVVDDMSSGTPERVSGKQILVCDIACKGAENRLSEFFLKHKVRAVLHFAAKKQVAESVANPLWYYQQNVEGTRKVLEASSIAGVKDFVFSSSAAVYGSPDDDLVSEQTSPEPINPYGESKLMSEWMVSAAARAHGLRTVSLRYFNVVGTANTTLADTGKFNLVPIIMDAVRRDLEVPIYGTDYPTIDGSCVRDYVHVADLADAHLSALDALVGAKPGASETYNVGTGLGTSVLEITDLVGRVSGIRVKQRLEDRRAGDPAALSADVHKIKQDLGWSSKQTVEDAIRSVWDLV